MNKVYLVYGNHGRSPGQLEDYHTYLNQALAPQGLQVLYTEDPVAGEFNILIEFFDLEFVHKVRKASKVSGTRMILIATEFLTGPTFNDFSTMLSQTLLRRSNLPKWVRSIGHAVGPILMPRFIRTMALNYLPDNYIKFRAEYRRHFGVARQSTYEMNQYWQDRYEFFCDVVPLCEQIWCVTPHQMPAYLQQFEGSNINLMPLVSWTEACSNSDQGKLEKDIDFLFTGSITPYRESVLKELKLLGYKVMEGPPTWPAYMRDHYVARSKVCLQIRQNPSWKYPSVMRYHHLLNSGAVIVADKGLETCMQETFLITTPPEEFVETCVRTLKNTDFLAQGRKAGADYYKASAQDRLEFARLLNPGGKKMQPAREQALNH